MPGVIDAQGTVFRIDGTVIGQARSWSGIGSGQAGERDRTTLANTDFKTFGVGLQDGGSVSIDVFPDTDDAGQRLVYQAYTQRTEHTFTVTLPNGVIFTYSGFVRQFEITGGQDADVTGTIQTRVNGAISGFPAPA